MKWHGKNELIPVYLENNIFNFYLNREVKSTETNDVNNDSGHAVYRSWCAACVQGRGVGGQHRIELLEEEERERATPIVAFRLRFSDTGKRRHVSNSDLLRQQVWSNGSEML